MLPMTWIFLSVPRSRRILWNLGFVEEAPGFVAASVAEFDLTFLRLLCPRKYKNIATDASNQPTPCHLKPPLWCICVCFPSCDCLKRRPKIQWFITMFINFPHEKTKIYIKWGRRTTYIIYRNWSYIPWIFRLYHQYGSYIPMNYPKNS